MTEEHLKFKAALNIYRSRATLTYLDVVLEHAVQVCHL